MLGHSPHSRLISTTLVIVFAFTCASIGTGQSGRRVRKPTPPPAASEPTPTSSPVSTEKQKPRLKLIVGIDRFDSFSGVPTTVYGGVLQSCADRLDDSSSVNVEVAQRDMSRSDAVDRAKTEKDAYVVWLQLRVDNMSSQRTGTLDNVYIEYAVFEPTSAKRITSGATYPRRKGNVVLGRRTSDIYNDRLLNEAARQAADRILTHFRIGLPPDRRF